ncbi:LysR family substrate-binding domain-containing protein [Microbacterium sp. NPDC056234]|uniref:LysR family substrate-binding domain-containing protein n=1 Tax=Microbacterium sp. NPDC056234 TaxID=3345757 RepID=UPI0035D7F1D4
MAKAGNGGRNGRAGGSRRTVSKGTPVRTGKGAPTQKKSTRGAQKNTAPAKKSGTPAPTDARYDAPASEPRTFRLGAIPGATPGKWIDAWKQRMPDVALELVPILFADQRTALEELDAALVRLPIEDADLHVIRLYDEVPVVVASAESHLLAADELEPSDLDGEVLLASDEDVLELDLPGTTASAYGAVPTTADLIATVATGAGIAVVPMSLARLHHRKDVDYRVLRDGPVSTVAFVWARERSTDDVDTFVGIIRGRTARSSR